MIDRLFKLEADVSRGEQADRELKLTAEAFKTVREELVNAWQATNPRDDKGREKLWVATTILTQVENTLRGVVNQGIVAAKEIEAIRRAGEPRKLPFRRVI